MSGPEQESVTVASHMPSATESGLGTAEHSQVCQAVVGLASRSITC